MLRKVAFGGDDGVVMMSVEFSVVLSFFLFLLVLRLRMIRRSRGKSSDTLCSCMVESEGDGKLSGASE